LVQTDRFRFGLVRLGLVFRTKTGSNRFGSVFSVWLGFRSVFSGLARFFQWLGLVRFFSGFFFGSVRFSRFQTYETKTEPVIFLKILIGLIDFFLRFDFFGYFFFIFSIFQFFYLPLIESWFQREIKWPCGIKNYYFYCLQIWTATKC
jgi:hypothetical protein